MKIRGVELVEPKRHRDHRGWFQEITNAMEITAGLPPFVQTNVSASHFGVIRGMHIQRRDPQGKLIVCLRGRIYDAWIDVRPESPTFGKWGALELDAATPHALYLPPGVAHGFQSVSTTCMILYACTTCYDRETDGGINWNDPSVGIEWPEQNPIVSDKDRRLPSLADWAIRVE